ncbi:MAG: hypothetical protein NZO58_00120 [Gemmataceae bacterium]|nr:hypothetical protein [Gemmataceae bacterium]
MRATDLQELLRRIDPAAVLVSPQVLDKVLKEKFGLPAFPWSAPHPTSCVAPREMLFRYVEQDELDLPAGELLPDPVHLLIRPTRDELSQPTGTLLLKYWRLLFHARVHAVLEAAPLSDAECQQRLLEASGGDSTELRHILIHDRLLPAKADARATYVEFAATYLEYRLFAPALLRNIFPRVENLAHVDALLRRDVDGAALFAATRLTGAADPAVASRHLKDEANQYYWRLLAQAAESEKAGNLVGAMILYRKAARVAPSDRGESTREESVAALRRLLPRLQPALEIPDRDLPEWEAMLTILLDRADQGARPVEAALLRDMQTICVDNEQEIYALDLVEWALTAGHRPIRRPLPSQRLVRITHHLRRAAQRIPAARLSDADRTRLGRLFNGRLQRCEERLRERFRPILVTAFHDVGLRPRFAPEHAAFESMTEELLDLIVANGFFTFGELRDVIAHNHLKLPDLADPQDFIRGDPLLRLDRRLGNLLDGVYRPSEVYLRILERLTSLNFGTQLGRLLTLWLSAPLLGAFILGVLLEIVIDWFRPAVRGQVAVAVVAGGPAALVADDLAVPPAPLLPLGGRLTVVLVLAGFLAALIHHQRFREEIWRRLVWCWGPLRVVFIDWPVSLIRHPLVQRVVASWTFQLFFWYVLQPLVAVLLLWLLAPELLTTWGAVALAFGVLALALHTRLVYAAGRVVAQVIVDLAHLIRAGLLPGLFRFIMALFRQILHLLETILFTVDEWLRFRSGEQWPSLAMRAVLNLLWLPISYVGRFYLIVLIEPCLNPLKLPIASVATKIMLPFLPLFNHAMQEALFPITGALVAKVFSWITTFFLPDAFGFLVWELKENWSLYRANRRPHLHAALIGEHGETIVGLLHPGFHSGAIPKLYGKLRRAARRAAETGDFYETRYYQQRLDQIAQRLDRFVKNELIAPLRFAASWRGLQFNIQPTQLANQRIRFLINLADHTQALVLDLSDHAGWLTARIAERGWLSRISSEQRRALTTAMAQFYKLAGVHVVWELFQTGFPQAVEAIDWTESGVTLRQGPSTAHYTLDSFDDDLRPDLLDGPGLAAWPILSAQRVVFGRMPLPWETVLGNWESDQLGRGHPPLVLAGQPLELLGPS